jgi:hypothetical protein
MPLIWTPVHSTATWNTSPTAPRIARAALKGLGWLVATEFERGWSTTFVPDPSAADPSEQAKVTSFHGAKVDWGASDLVEEHHQTKPALVSQKPRPVGHQPTKAPERANPGPKRKG